MNGKELADKKIKEDGERAGEYLYGGCTRQEHREWVRDVKHAETAPDPDEYNGPF